MELYEKGDGTFAVLVSPGYGAGWSTWDRKELAYDKRIIEYYLAHCDDRDFMVKAYTLEVFISAKLNGCRMGLHSELMNTMDLNLWRLDLAVLRSYNHAES